MECGEYIGVTMSTGGDVSRLLYTVFDDSLVGGLSRENLIRSWSLEIQWFTPEEAEEIVDKLIELEWLEGKEGTLSPSIGVQLIAPELGWRPMTRRILTHSPFQKSTSPPSNIFSTPTVSQGNIEKKDMKKHTSSLSTPTVHTNKADEIEVVRRHPIDRAEASIPILIELIARESGLENKEVVRRAQRKRRALGPVTLWMALALVAREQSLDMFGITSEINRIED